QTVTDIDGRVSKQEQTVSGMQSVVYDPETGLSSLNTQLANLIQVAVTGEEMTGAISVLENNINLRVEKGDVINQINISDENILIQANKIMALGDVVVDGKLTITDEFIAPNAQIDGAKIADATIGSAKIASLDVSKISGNTAEFVRGSFNHASGGQITLDGERLQFNQKGTLLSSIYNYNNEGQNETVFKVERGQYLVFHNVDSAGIEVPAIRIGDIGYTGFYTDVN